MPKLLAPAGDYECLLAAVFAGADEVYFGLDGFNARKNAKNFTFDKAVEAIRFCRVRNVKTNITLNTLLYGKEYDEVLSLVEKLENTEKPDSYIVQDIGLAFALKEKFGSIPLHASTQMEIHGSYSAEMLKDLGFTRIVLAREMNKDEISAFASAGVETEVFVHGAMCVCQSGGCLMSSMIGKRSGNRGECAYPCRLMYNKCYPLSLKDMCLAKHIPLLAEMGVSALKLEGRMKSADYVYRVTKIYRRLIDENRMATNEEITELENIFSRSGFTDGYFTGRIGKGMFGIRTDKDKEKTRETETQIIPSCLKASMVFYGSTGDRSRLEMSADGVTVCAEGDIIEIAKNMPASESDIKKQLSKLGGTSFEASDIAVYSSNDGFYPVSALNSLRRQAVSLLENSLCEKHKRIEANEIALPCAKSKDMKKILTIRFEGKEISPNAVKEADMVEIPIVNHNMWITFEEKQKLSLLLPGFIFDSEKQRILSLLEEAKQNGITKVTLPNFSFIPLCKGFEIHGGYECNCISSQTAIALEKMGFTSVCASPEAKNAMWKNASVLVYGKVKLMHTRNCLIRNYGKCTEGKGGSLTDRTGTAFNVICGENHTNYIYNSVPVWLFDKSIGCSSTVVFTDEDCKTQESLLNAYKNSLPPKGRFTRAYR